MLRDTTPRAGLAESCRTALKKWEWSPATKDGQRVKTFLVGRMKPREMVGTFVDDSGTTGECGQCGKESPDAR